MRKPYYKDNHRTIYKGDFRENDLPDNFVQCVVTSPPYWGLRKYEGEQECKWNGWRGAYGLEPTPEMYVSHTIEILREIRRVLRKDGVVFWNVGDSYMSSPSNQQANVGQRYKTIASRGKRVPSGSIKPKDLCLIPFRVAIAAQEDGWWIRSVIIWSKPNPMPESVRDRPTESHEYILMMTKNSKYYWDQDAVREPCNYLFEGKWSQTDNKGYQNNQNMAARKLHEFVNDGGRNIRSVWEFPTQPYPEAHFAVFPEKLPELCIKAATPEVGCCAKCGKPWERVTERENMVIMRTDWGEKAGNRTATSGTMVKPTSSRTLGWQPACKCNAERIPSTVLDPFMGSGTTLLVAANLNRKAIGYDLSEEYVNLAIKRNRQQVLI